MGIENRYTIHLFGRFRVTDPSGNEIHFRSAKAQALLALLATVPELDRGRIWLQDKLWSDRGPTEAARSLRQELTQIKKRFNTSHEVFSSDRRRVWLNPDLVNVAPNASSLAREFLEGIDVADPEFNDWMARQRAASSRSDNPIGSTANAHTPGTGGDASAAVSGRIICFVPPEDGQNTTQWTIAGLYDCVAKNLRELLGAEVRLEFPKDPKPGLLMVSARPLRQSNGLYSIRIALDELERRGTLWSSTLADWSPDRKVQDDHRCMALVSQLTDRVCETWVSGTWEQSHNLEADAAAHLAVRKLFTIEAGQIDEAEVLLEQAYEQNPRGVYQAWLAQLYAFKHVERLSNDHLGLSEGSRRACALALQKEPTNSFVLSAVANATTIFERNFVGGGELAELSVRTNPANPFGWWALSNAYQYSNNVEAAYKAAQRSQSLTADTAFRFWGDFQLALTAALTGRHDEAIRLGETASLLAPKFRPPLRYLIALHALRDDHDSARRCVDRLILNENDFSLELLSKDKDYPVSVMRENGLLDDERLRSVQNE